VDGKVVEAEPAAFLKDLGDQPELHLAIAERQDVAPDRLTRRSGVGVAPAPGEHGEEGVRVSPDRCLHGAGDDEGPE
jgi:hypothetical protein